MSVNYRLDKFIIPVIFKNPYVMTDEDKEKLFNTGMSASGYPFSDEDQAYKGLAEIPGQVGPTFEDKHLASIRLFRNNEYIYLAPGDEVSITIETPDEAAYYLGFQDTDLLVFSNREEFLQEDPLSLDNIYVSDTNYNSYSVSPEVSYGVFNYKIVKNYGWNPVGNFTFSVHTTLPEVNVDLVINDVVVASGVSDPESYGVSLTAPAAPHAGDNMYELRLTKEGKRPGTYKLTYPLEPETSSIYLSGVSYIDPSTFNEATFYYDCDYTGNYDHPDCVDIQSLRVYYAGTSYSAKLNGVDIEGASGTTSANDTYISFTTPELVDGSNELVISFFVEGSKDPSMTRTYTFSILKNVERPLSIKSFTSPYFIGLPQGELTPGTTYEGITYDPAGGAIIKINGAYEAEFWLSTKSVNITVTLNGSQVYQESYSYSTQIFLSKGNLAVGSNVLVITLEKGAQSCTYTFNIEAEYTPVVPKASSILLSSTSFGSSDFNPTQYDYDNIVITSSNGQFGGTVSCESSDYEMLLNGDVILSGTGTYFDLSNPMHHIQAYNGSNMLVFKFMNPIDHSLYSTYTFHMTAAFFPIVPKINSIYLQGATLTNPASFDSNTYTYEGTATGYIPYGSEITVVGFNGIESNYSDSGVPKIVCNLNGDEFDVQYQVGDSYKRANFNIPFDSFIVGSNTVELVLYGAGGTPSDVVTYTFTLNKA